MSWDDQAVALIAPFEGCEQRINGLVRPYLDRLAKPHIWTRGYGRTYGITAVSPPITVGQAKLELRQGVIEYGRRVAAMSPSLLLIDDCCLAAVTSWAWNCGLGAYRVSRLRRAIDAGYWLRASELMLSPNTAGGVVYKGLVRRRQAEQVIFLMGINSGDK